MDSRILPNWKSEDTAAFGQKTLLMQHTLSETGLFDRDVLAELIETVPAHAYNLNTMGWDHTNPEWREGRLPKISGHEAIEAIARGRMWLNMRKLQSWSPRHAQLLDRMYDEFEKLIPGFSTFRQSLGLLISSPNVQVFYHADIPGQSLWQLEGKKRVYIYPNQEPFLPQKSLEGIILGETEEEIDYQPGFDDKAEVFDLEPGQALNWALNGPHRVENADCLNISVTTEHWTSDIRKSYAVHYANGVLRRRLGLDNLSPSIETPLVYPKAALAAFWRKLDLNSGDKVQRVTDFELDPTADKGIRDVEQRPKETAG